MVYQSCFAMISHHDMPYMIKFINNGDANAGILIMNDGEPEIHSLKATPDGTIMHNDEHNADK